MSSLRRAIRNTATRLDDSEMAEELACQRERANWLATRYGLPAIGSRLVNQHGIEWVVQEHVAIPTYDSLNRWREGEVVPAHDLYPVIVPKNLSPKLTEFLLAIDRCTTKTFAFVDTMPGRRRDGHVPGGNQIDTICHPSANIVHVDAARIHETIIAHELGHAWVQYVDECEDLRVLREVGDPQRMRLLCFVQSFVLDLKVNQLIRRKGFDMTPIDEDHHASVVQLAEFLSKGGKTDLPREEVVWAMSIAELLLVSEGAHGSDLANLDAALPVIRQHAPNLFALADTMAAAIRRHGYASREGILASIDVCLKAAFKHSGECIDIEHGLIAVQSDEPNLDKWPSWIDGASVTLKTTVGKVMAREDISSSVRWSLSDRGHQTLLHFILPNGEQTESWVLDHPFPFHNPSATVRMARENQRRHTDRLVQQLAEVDRINRENRERYEQMLRQAGVRLPTIPQMPSVPLSSYSGPITKDVGSRPNGLGLPPGKQVPSLQSVNRSGATPLALVSSDSLSLPTKARNYMAGLGRFLTAARLAEQVQGEHPYGYAFNNPVTYTDPKGLQPKGRPGPSFNPGFWNSPGIIDNNNCYSYACNWPWGVPAPGGKPQPGDKSGGLYNNFPGGTPSCTNIVANAKRDRLIFDIPRGGCPSSGHKVCLYITPSGSPMFPDYHWYRQDNDGYWSSKHGLEPITRCYPGTNIPITNPDDDARRWGYGIKCGCYCAKGKAGIR